MATALCAVVGLDTATVRGTDKTFVVEPASNDGCLLREIQRWTPKVLGIEPAQNIAAEATPTASRHFRSSSASTLPAVSVTSYGPADVIIGTNVLAHVPDIVDFVRGAAHLLADEEPRHRGAVPPRPRGPPRLRHDLPRARFVSVGDRARSHVRDGRPGTRSCSTRSDPRWIDTVSRLTRVATSAIPQSDNSRRRAGSRLWGRTALRGFGGRVDALRSDLHETVAALERFGYRVAAYGATAKGNTCFPPAKWATKASDM